MILTSPLAVDLDLAQELTVFLGTYAHLRPTGEQPRQLERTIEHQSLVARLPLSDHPEDENLNTQIWVVISSCKGE